MKYYKVCERRNVSCESFIPESDKNWYSEEDYVLTEIHPTAQQMVWLMTDDFEAGNRHSLRSVPQKLFDVLDEIVPDFTDLIMRKIYEEGVFNL